MFIPANLGLSDKDLKEKLQRELSQNTYCKLDPKTITAISEAFAEVIRQNNYEIAIQLKAVLNLD